MTHDEMIAVIQAHKEGKVIEINCGEGWMNMYNPNFNFMDYKYRIKIEPDSKPHYRPFKSAEEVMEAIKEHGSWVYMPSLEKYSQITEFTDSKIYAGSMDEFGIEFNNIDWVFVDGTPFGVKEDRI